MVPSCWTLGSLSIRYLQLLIQKLAHHPIPNALAPQGTATTTPTVGIAPLRPVATDPPGGGAIDYLLPVPLAALRRLPKFSTPPSAADPFLRAAPAETRNRPAATTKSLPVLPAGRGAFALPLRIQRRRLLD